jgi:hypothetical protein
MFGKVKTEIAAATVSVFSLAGLASPASAREYSQPDPITAPATPPAATPAAAPAHDMVKMLLKINGTDITVERSNRPLVMSNATDRANFEFMAIGKSLEETLGVPNLEGPKNAFKNGILATMNLDSGHANFPQTIKASPYGQTIIDGMKLAGITGAAIGASKTPGEYVVVLNTAQGTEVVTVNIQNAQALTGDKTVSFREKQEPFQTIMRQVVLDILKMYNVELTLPDPAVRGAAGGVKQVAPGANGAAPAQKAAPLVLTPDQLAEALKTAKPYSEEYKQALSGSIPTNNAEILDLKAKLTSLSLAVGSDIAAVKAGDLNDANTLLAIKRLLNVDKANAGHLKEAELKGIELNTITVARLEQLEVAGRTSKSDEKRAEKDAQKERISPSSSSLSVLEEVAKDAYAVKYSVELKAVPPEAYRRGLLTTIGTAQAIRDKQMEEVNRNLAGLEAVLKGTEADMKIIQDAIKKGINSSTMAAAVRLGRSPADALNLKPEQLPGLFAEAKAQNSAARHQIGENKKAKSAIGKKVT